eukprot:TRINITY_DN3647_c0_g3_i1.p1 TRINITY_DN3647_c0_g3~~TRINITY_DN3647_c0_g3_i1.p1  ORF type:complete len:368 (+),score=84.81 TRINITY_DN3647_c0_g3_i1:338-1441(+)
MGDSEMAEEEVRAAIPAFEDQMIDPAHERRRMEEAMAADAAAMQRRMTFDRGNDSAGAGAGTGEGDSEDEDSPMDTGGGNAINKLFAPPSYNQAGAYYETLEKAKSEGKWVLVNIQQAEVFASHTLNRDVWRDETIQNIIDGSFLFWQRDDKSTEGDQFCQYHSCGHQLPHICVIDPRTQRRLQHWDGRKWVESHAAAEFLLGFLDRFSMSRSPPALSPAASPAMAPAAQPFGTEGKMELVGLDEDMTDRGAAGSGEAPDIAEPEAPPKEPAPALPDEPGPDTEHVKVRLSLPGGAKVTRRFLSNNPVEEMFTVAAALSNEPIRLVDLCTQFPTRSLRDIEGGLQVLIKDAQVAGNMLMVTIRTDGA